MDDHRTRTRILRRAFKTTRFDCDLEIRTALIDGALPRHSDQYLLAVKADLIVM